MDNAKKFVRFDQHPTVRMHRIELEVLMQVEDAISTRLRLDERPTVVMQAVNPV